MEKKAYYKYMLIIGSIWNLALAVPILIMSFFISPGLSILGLLYYQAFLWAVILFGIGYGVVGLNIDNNHALIVLGVIGKILVFLYYMVYFLLGILDISYVMIGTGDLIFALLFIEFLINYKKL
ncbi:MAG: hypothetical protein ACFE8A_08565 [Candidatus Hodarchaeota archaeon]